MGTFTLTIETDNAAFDDEPRYEVARILRDAADAYAYNGETAWPLRDVNGNRVGQWTFTATPETVAADALDDVDTLDDALDALGWDVDVIEGDGWWTDEDRARARAGGDAASFFATAHPWSWRITDPAGATLDGAYWTGSAITDEPDPVDVVHSLLMDVSALDEYDPDLPTGMTLADYREVRARETWMRDRAGDAFDRLAELAADYDR